MTVNFNFPAEYTGIVKIKSYDELGKSDGLEKEIQVSKPQEAMHLIYDVVAKHVFWIEMHSDDLKCNDKKNLELQKEIRFVQEINVNCVMIVKSKTMCLHIFFINRSRYI